ncbi:MAG: BphX family protein [Lewinellaceae bacterium]|nr:BphX family protein [Lewinellaceae bacterium]
MRKLQWWMRIVGGFYLLLTLMNLYGLFSNPHFFKGNLPAPINTDELAVRSFTDAWMVFVFELGCIGAVLLWFSKNPMGNRGIIWLVILAEIFRGIVCDAIWITRGYNVASYVPFIIVHLVIIATGWWFLRQAEKS